MKKETLKAYVISYTMADSHDVKSIAIIAYNKQEAGDLFIRYAKAENIYDAILGIVVQETHKNKQNKGMFTESYYKMQYDFVKGCELRKDKAQ